MALVTLHDVGRVHRRGGEVVHALEGVSAALAAGELVGLVGPSGSGKTTLLNLIAGWEAADTGTVCWRDGTPPAALGWHQLAIVPQALGLLGELTVWDNVALPARLSGSEPDVEALLDALAIAHLAERRAGEVSLGEQQRAAVARALAGRPDLVLADEPTAHQDQRRSALVFSALRAAADAGATCLVATHDRAHLAACDRFLRLRSGRLSQRRRLPRL